MAEIRSFRGLRFAPGAGKLDTLVAPPYDVLTPRERDEYAVRNPHNIVHLTLPEQNTDDRSKYIKYARSGALLNQWRTEGVLVPEDQPAIYRYTQRFGRKADGSPFTRVSLIALIKTEPYDKGVVLPHEQTFPKHKEDRLRILEATRAHLESIFGLYEDPDGEVLAKLRSAPAQGGVRCGSQDLVQHELEPITDPTAVAEIAQLLADKKVWIADGHHRYETAVAFREALGHRDEIVPEDYMVIALSSMSDPNLLLLPTHRVLAHLPNITRTEFLTRLSTLFNIQEVHSSRLEAMLEDSRVKGNRAFAVAMPGGLGYFLTPLDDEALLGQMTGDASHALKALDVTILHSVIFEQLLGLKGTDGIIYTRDGHEAIRLADEGAEAAFLMNPPTVDDMRVIAGGGEKMPQKSTFYFPKILSGLVIWSLSDF